MKKNINLLSMISISFLLSSPVLASDGIAPPAYEEGLRRAEITVVRINGCSIDKALAEGIITESWSINHQADELHIGGEEDADLPRIFEGYKYEAFNLSSVHLTASHTPEGLLDINIQDERLEEQLSSVRKENVLITLDELAKILTVNNRAINGITLPVIYGGRSVRVAAADAIITKGVLSSRGPIDLTAEKMTFNQQLVRTPTGLFLAPKDSIRAQAIFTEITFTPNLKIYRDSDAQLQQSWTSLVNGEVNFTTGETDLTALNASLIFNLNKDVRR